MSKIELKKLIAENSYRNDLFRLDEKN